MGHDYEKSKKIALSTIILLGVITIAEVIFALLGKGYIIKGLHFPVAIMGGVMIIMSLTKAYYIVYEFMHLKYEVPGLLKSVILPTALLIWAVIAFLYEGNDWGNRRSLIKNKNEAERQEVIPGQTGMIYIIGEENKL